MAAIKSAGNSAVSYNGNAITNYCNQSDLANTIAELESTHLGSTAQTADAGLPGFTLNIGGDWGATIDGYLGPDSLTGAKRTVIVSHVDGATTITYTWTASGDVGGFITNYQIQSPANGKKTWTAQLRLSGLGIRAAS